MTFDKVKSSYKVFDILTLCRETLDHLDLLVLLVPKEGWYVTTLFLSVKKQKQKLKTMTTKGREMKLKSKSGNRQRQFTCWDN